MSAVAMLVGTVVLVVTAIPFTKYVPSPVFPIVFSAVASFRLARTALVAFVLGAGMGGIAPRHWVLLGLSVVGGFPLMIAVELLVEPRSHNMFPFELAVFGVLAGISTLGAAAGKALRMRWGQGSGGLKEVG
jgi:hypothetical protein